MNKNEPCNSWEGAVIDLFGLDTSQIETISTELREKTHFIHISLVPSYPPCPRCQERNVKVFNYNPRAIAHPILKQSNCVLLYRQRRYKCPFCGRTYSEKNPFSFPRRRISSAGVMSILEDLHDPTATFQGVAQKHNISATSVQNIFDQHIDYPPAKKLARVIQIDEVYAFQSENSKFVCMILDYDTQMPVDVLPTRKKEDLLKFFRSIPLEERRKVKFASSDMYTTYRDVVKAVLPNAIFAVDRFHVSQEFSRRLTDIRIRVMKNSRLTDQEYYLLKHQNHLLGVLPWTQLASKKGGWYTQLDKCAPKTFNQVFNRKMNDHELLEKLLQISPQLEEGYLFRVRLSNFYRYCTFKSAPNQLRELITDLNTSGIPELVQFAGTLTNWFQEIVNSFKIVKTEYITKGDGSVKKKDHRLTSSLIENRNKVLKQLKHSSNGYTCWKRFRNRVLYVMDKNPHIRSQP